MVNPGVSVGVAVAVLLAAALACSARDAELDPATESLLAGVAEYQGSPEPEPTRELDADTALRDASATSADAEREVCQSGTVVIMADDFIGVDPARYDYGSSFPYELVYSRMFGINSETGEVEPDLATSYTVSADGRTYSIRLRDDVHYSDGTPFAPSDIQFSFARALRERPATTANYVLGGIAGAEDLVNGSATELKGVTIVDDSTIEIRLDAPDWDFAAKLAHPVASIVREENVAQWEDGWTARVSWSSPSGYPFAPLPIGTGPFTVEELKDIGGSAAYVPNGRHWNGPPQPSLVQRKPDVRHRRGHTPSFAEFDIFEVGRRAAFAFDRGSPTTIDGDSLVGYNLVASERIPEIAFLAFNTAIPPFDDVHFRRALLASADTRALGYHESAPALRETATGLMPPTMAGFVERPELTPDREATLTLAEESQYFDLRQSPEVALWVTGAFSPYDIDTVTRFWARWLEVDIDVWGMRETDFGYTVSANHTAGYEARLAHGSLQMRFVEVQPTRNSPEEVLGIFRNLFGANAMSTEVEELNAMLDAAAAEPDATKRTDLYTEIEDHILDRALAIPIAWGSPTKWEVVREWVHGYEPSPYAPLSLAGVTVDTTHPDYPADRPCN